MPLLIIVWKYSRLLYTSFCLVIVPEGDKKALAAYNEGKKFFYAKRGQLNLSCADCHVTNPGQRIRGNTLSPALGQVTHFPVWRGKWAKKKGNNFFHS
jgi:sulfur-oxidizing protein SoxA